MDISRSTIDRERWQIKKRGKYQRNKTLKRRVTIRQEVGPIGAAFQRWRELKQREGLESDAEVALFLLDR